MGKNHESPQQGSMINGVEITISSELIAEPLQLLRLIDLEYQKVKKDEDAQYSCLGKVLTAFKQYYESHLPKYLYAYSLCDMYLKNLIQSRSSGHRPTILFGFSGMNNRLSKPSGFD